MLQELCSGSGNFIMFLDVTGMNSVLLWFRREWKPSQPNGFPWLCIEKHSCETDWRIISECRRAPTRVMLWSKSEQMTDRMCLVMPAVWIFRFLSTASPLTVEPELCETLRAARPSPPSPTSPGESAVTHHLLSFSIEALKRDRGKPGVTVVISSRTMLQNSHQSVRRRNRQKLC